MAERWQIMCIDKRNHCNPHERIQAVGGVFPNGVRWKLLEDHAILAAESHHLSFYVSVGGRPVDVIVDSHNGRKYLKTRSDGDALNTLLSMPESP